MIKLGNGRYYLTKVNIKRNQKNLCANSSTKIYTCFGCGFEYKELIRNASENICLSWIVLVTLSNKLSVLLSAQDANIKKCYLPKALPTSELLQSTGIFSKHLTYCLYINYHAISLISDLATQALAWSTIRTYMAAVTDSTK